MSSMGRAQPGERQRWARLLAETALDLSAEELTAFLAHTVHDEGLRQEVEELVSADRAASEFLEEPALGVSPAWAAEPEWLMRRGTLGPFRLESCLGKGGMGVVFLAQREGDETPLALKVTWSNPSLIARLDSEGKILARLRHPGIAAVLDTGTTEGLPYVALEYVAGTPIDQHLATVPWRRVVEIFLEICDAVEYAHRNLVVHRDLKPDHILIDADGRPKLLDFGIAKLLGDSGLAAQTSTATRLAGSPVTPSFASLEQLRGEPVTTASDIYSLGVVLYKTLTGVLPRDIQSLRVKDLENAFSSLPQAASAAALLTQGDDLTARWGGAEFAHDLDAVVLKALRPEPEARYRTVAEFTEDLGRCLSGTPVAARRSTPFYLASRTLRRYRGLVAAVSLLVIFLTAFGIRESIQSDKLEQQRDRAEAEKTRAEAEQAQAQQVTTFVVDLLRQTAPETTKPATESIDQLLARGTQQLDSGQALGSRAREELLTTLGEMNLKRRRLNEADRQLQEASELRSARLGDEAPELAEIWLLRAQVKLQKASLILAESLTRSALTLRRKNYAADPAGVAECLALLSSILAQQIQPAAVEEAAREAIRIWQSTDGDFSRAIAGVDADRAMVLRMQGNFPKAAHLLRTSLKRLRLSEEALFVADYEEELAMTLAFGGSHLDEAEALLADTFALRSATYGPESPTTAKTRLRRGHLFLAQGKISQARLELEKALEISRAALDFNTIGEALLFLGDVFQRLGDFRRAEASLLECERLINNVFRRNHPYRLLPILELTAVALARQDLETANAHLDRGRAICEANPEFNWCSDLKILKGRTLLAQGQTTRGRQELTEGHALLLATLGESHHRTQKAMRFLKTSDQSVQSTPAT